MRRRVGLFGIICLMTLRVVAGGVAISNVSALSYQSNIGVGFTFNPTLSVSLSNSDLVINNLSPNTGLDSNIITVNIATNATYGYDLFSTVGNTTNATTELKNGNNSFASLSSNVATLASFDDNKWGYSYSTDSGVSWVSGDQGSTSNGYAGLPLYTSTGVKLASANSNTDSSVQFKIAAKAGATQASGAYTNVVNFMAVSKVAPLSLLDAFIASGAEQINGYYKMQDMTSSICNAVDNSLIPSELQLIDERDNKLYWVAKLADGNCWMTQNLALDFNDANGKIRTFTSNDTNLKVKDSPSGAYVDGYSISGDVISWVPEAATLTSVSGWTNDYNNPRSLNSGISYPDSNATQPKAGDHGLAGNYYNWTAAIASNNSQPLSSATYATPDQNPKNSICPKGWRLPVITDYSSLEPGDNDFANLNYYYNGGKTNTATGIMNSPLWFVRSGNVDGTSIGNLGYDGYYWSSTVLNNYGAFYLHFSSDNVGPIYLSNSDNGFPVRCVSE